MENQKYIPVEQLKVYQLARLLSSKSWEIYSAMKYEEKKIMGDQFIRAVDSVGANIVERHFISQEIYNELNTIC